jgi:hypothetical protein
MREQPCERIPSSIAMRAQFIECSQAPIRVLVSGLGVSAPYRFGLRFHMPCKLLNQFFKTRQGQIPFLMFLIVSRPNSRCAS